MNQQWDPDRYRSEVGFVAALGEPLIDLLKPQVGERILDLGCGDGALTVKLLQYGCEVVAVDSSADQIAAARERGLDAYVVDGHALNYEREFHGVLSNAALHWMKRPDEVLSGVANALVEGGRFVAEFGGAGNVGTIVAAIERLLRERGVDPDSCNPWYFPSSGEYAERLREHGFDVLEIAHFPRPTPLSVDITAWLEIFAQSFFHAFEAREKTQLLETLRETLRPHLADDGGNWHVDYVRLRFAAVKRAKIET